MAKQKEQEPEQKKPSGLTVFFNRFSATITKVTGGV
jgi:hypothetical protein